MNTPVNRSIFNDTGCIRREELLRYRDNRMSNSEKHDVEEHLVDCELCTDALEGLMLISSVAVLDEVSQEVGRITSPSTGAIVRPWLAAATIAGVVVISYLTYRQYSDLKEERIAQTESVANERIPAAVKQPAVTSDSLKELPLQTDVTSEKPVGATRPAESVSEMTLTETKSESDFSSALTEEPMMSKDQEVAEIAAQTGQATTIQAESAKEISFSSAPSNNAGNQNITYIDNVKVIDYNDYEKMPASVADVPRSTPSKFQNDKKRVQAAEAEEKSGVAAKRKANYLDMVADPVILFNNGRFESANQGFDELLKRNSNDQNAAFYKGVSLYNMKQYDPALELLEPLSNDTASPFMEEAKYYTAKSYIANGKVNKGKILLEGISNSNGFYSNQAKYDLKNIKP